MSDVGAGGFTGDSEVGLRDTSGGGGFCDGVGVVLGITGGSENSGIAVTLRVTRGVTVSTMVEIMVTAVATTTEHWDEIVVVDGWDVVFGVALMVADVL